jgi:hypothetical protein
MVFRAVGGDRAPRKFAEVGHPAAHGGPLVDLGELGLGADEADFQPFDFPEPAFAFGLELTGNAGRDVRSPAHAGGHRRGG